MYLSSIFFRKGGVRTRVCKKFFTSTLHIGHSPISLAIRGRGAAGVFIAKDRGRRPPINKTKESDLDRVRRYINSFPRTPFHYTRASSKREYLDPSLTIKKMYELYVEDHQKKRLRQGTYICCNLPQSFLHGVQLVFLQTKKGSV